MRKSEEDVECAKPLEQTKGFINKLQLEYDKSKRNLGFEKRFTVCFLCLLRNNDFVYGEVKSN